VTGALVRPFVFLDRHVPAVRRHGYLLATVVTKPARPPRRRSAPEWIPALNDAEQQDDDGDDEQDVDQASECVGRHDSEQPQDEKNDDDG
jgi:hypothetical protein